MEGVVTSAFHGRSVLVTGHTGFKGGWLTMWLHRLGAVVHGYSLEPPTTPNLFEAARIASLLASDTRADINDLARMRQAFQATRPEIVFHLAAQPLVRESYRDPVATFGTNVIGTAHVLEAARHAESVRVVLLITTDKVYETLTGQRPYTERDPLGGHDPYSASKAAAEIVIASYRRSFYANTEARVASARAGNVIGGGDWAADRLVPDCFRAFEKGESVRLRYPDAVRPWQHVLEPLSGYLQLAERLLTQHGARWAEAWNFGPDAADDATVEHVAQLVARLWGGHARVKRAPSTEHPHETGFLRLDSTHARKDLGWQPRWGLDTAVKATVDWHHAWRDGRTRDMLDFSLRQIEAYENARK